MSVKKHTAQDNYNSSPYKWTFEEKLAGSEYVVRFSLLGYLSPSAPGSIADDYFNIKLVPTNQSLDEYYEQYLNTNVFSKEGFSISTSPTYQDSLAFESWVMPIKEFDLLTPATSEHKIFLKKDGYIVNITAINGSGSSFLNHQMVVNFFHEEIEELFEKK